MDEPREDPESQGEDRAKPDIESALEGLSDALNEMMQELFTSLEEDGEWAPKAIGGSGSSISDHGPSRVFMLEDPSYYAPYLDTYDECDFSDPDEPGYANVRVYWPKLVTLFVELADRWQITEWKENVEAVDAAERMQGEPAELHPLATRRQVGFQGPFDAEVSRRLIELGRLPSGALRWWCVKLHRGDLPVMIADHQGGELYLFDLDDEAERQIRDFLPDSCELRQHET